MRDAPDNLILRQRRGVSRGTFLTFLICIILAGAGGAIAWEIYGNDVRSRLGIIHREIGEATPFHGESANEPIASRNERERDS
jgi:hypothetical protein